MTQFSNNKDDERLVEFLHQHRPEVPPATPDLEQLIIQKVAASPPLNAVRHRRMWLIPPAIAAGLVIIWIGYRILTPASSFSTAQLANLNAFLENNWDGILGSSADAQTLPIASTTNN
ncbi:MAG: hypothetical protein JOZ78_11745 [Chroococcidiopsidaceae cyanobacterium CP_BM_ER_R8_30]|nr:hypothetical protein [Chroococcidiopsidaceae cyanobacterium CP_BM_ER_R8_30]